MMASNAIMPYAFIKPLEGEFSMSLSISMRFHHAFSSTAGAMQPLIATISMINVNHPSSRYGSLKIRPQENSLDGMGAE
jgi:hypothetical protein